MENYDRNSEKGDAFRSCVTFQSWYIHHLVQESLQDFQNVSRYFRCPFWSPLRSQVSGSIALVIIALLLPPLMAPLWAQAKSAQSDTGSDAWMTGVKLGQALDQPVIATWQNAELRTALRALSLQRHVAIVLDRRLDPNHKFSLETRGETLQEVLGLLAKKVNGSLSITGQVVYIGPIDAVAKIRTLLTLRRDEIQKLASQLPSSQRSQWNRTRPLRWDDLDTPAEILERLIHERDPQLKAVGMNRIPHDLWATGATANVTLAEALTLILIQFDLTFQMNPTGTEIVIQPIPEKVSIERQFPLPKAKAEQISQAVRSVIPQLDSQATPEQLVARGTQEQLDELERLIRSITNGTSSTKKTSSPAPLARRRMTFQAKDVPLKAVLEKLATTGIQFEYNVETLRTGGIDIEKLIAIDVKDVPISEMFDKLFSPVGISYRVDGLKVNLDVGKVNKER